MKIKITADRVIDLPVEVLEQKGISTISVYINLGSVSYSDLDDIQIEDVFEYTDKNREVPKTAARSPEQYKKFFAEFASSYDYVLHFAASSKISSICSHAIKASESFNGKVIVFDTKNLSNGVAVLALKAYDLIKNNTPIEKIVEIINNTIPNVQGSFILDKLDNIYLGGRCSGLQYRAAKIFNLKVVISMNEDGHMSPRNKYRGALSISVKKYIKATFEQKPNPNLKQIFLIYSTKNDEMINLIKEEVLKFYPTANIIANKMGCNCAVHSGRNTYGLFYETV